MAAEGCYTPRNEEEEVLFMNELVQLLSWHFLRQCFTPGVAPGRISWIRTLQHVCGDLPSSSLTVKSTKLLRFVSIVMKLKACEMEDGIMLPDSETFSHLLQMLNCVQKFQELQDDQDELVDIITEMKCQEERADMNQSFATFHTKLSTFVMRSVKKLGEPTVYKAYRLNRTRPQQVSHGMEGDTSEMEVRGGEGMEENGGSVEEDGEGKENGEGLEGHTSAELDVEGGEGMEGGTSGMDIGRGESVDEDGGGEEGETSELDVGGVVEDGGGGDGVEEDNEGGDSVVDDGGGRDSVEEDGGGGEGVEEDGGGVEGVVDDGGGGEGVVDDGGGGEGVVDDGGGGEGVVDDGGGGEGVVDDGGGGESVEENGGGTEGMERDPINISTDDSEVCVVRRPKRRITRRSRRSRHGVTGVPSYDEGGDAIAWSDESSEVRTPPSRLPTLRSTITVRSRDSLLGTPHHKQFAPRNFKRMPFSGEEVHYLEEGVKKFGVGQWKKILQHYKFQPKRTNIDLKDKWRNLLKKRSV